MPDYKSKSYKVRRAMLSRAIARRGWRCVICGLPIATRAERLAVTLEHITPRSQGGTDDDENLGPAHGSCNYSRQAKPLTVPVHSGADFFS